MGTFSLSPAVAVREIDLSAVISSATSSLGAYAGKFNWGPVNEPTLIADETSLVRQFGYPNDYNATDFFTIASFFAYTSGAWVTRIGNSQMKNAGLIFGQTNPVTAPARTIINANDFTDNRELLNDVSVIAKYPGITGNALSVSICTSVEQYHLDLSTADGVTLPKFNFKNGASAIRSKEIPYTLTDSATKIDDFIRVGDYLIIDNVRYYIADVQIDKIVIDRIYIGSATPSEIVRQWKYSSEFATPPETNSFHLVVIDTIGYFQQAGSILETFADLSITDKSAADAQGQSLYWTDAINRKSTYLYAGEIAPDTNAKSAFVGPLTGGTDVSATVGLDEYITAYSLYTNSEVYDAPLLIGGNAITTNDASGAVLANYLIYSIAEMRKDMITFVSPPLEAVLNNRGKEAISCVKARQLLGSSSYATMDCNWKYMYDKYNDTFRWIPMNGDIAGVYARNDRERDAWISAAGTTKGRLKNIVKFAWNPDKTARDVLYPGDVNPVFSLPVAGPVLFGDKTLLGKNTALSRINVRRLLIILEKAIATAALDLLFEFNDEFTQRKFISMVDPLLKDAKNRRGLTAYKIVADSTVNTPQIIQNNSFVGQIYLRPQYSINDIRLDFVVINASASFEEVVGSV